MTAQDAGGAASFEGAFVASAYAELGFHALAHIAVPASNRVSLLARAASMHDARYVAWALATLPSDVVEPIAQDADAIAGLLARAPAADVLAVQTLPALHHDLQSFMATARRGIARLEPRDVANDVVLGALQAASPALPELVRCTMLLAARAWRDAHHDCIEPEVEVARKRAADGFGAAAAVAPRLRRHRVELAFALGARGRVIGDRIWVGVPAAWNGLPDEHAALQALHEAAACVAGEIDHSPDPASAASALEPSPERQWASAEGLALAAVSMVVRGTDLERPHAAWLARLDVGGVETPDDDAAAEVARRLRSR